MVFLNCGKDQYVRCEHILTKKKFAHTSTFDLAITDALFDMNYIALNVGSDIKIGGDALTNETCTVSTANKITVLDTPVDFGGSGTIGWASISGEDDWQMVTFTGKDATVTGAKVGEAYCVRYNAFFDGLQEVTVSSNIIPSIGRAVLTANLYTGKVIKGSASTSSKVGQIQIEIPSFQLNGAQTLSMSMTGASQTSLSGSALQSFDGGSCDGGGYYSKIKQIITGAKWYDNNVVDLAVQGGDVVTGSKLIVRAIYANAIPSIIPSSDVEIDTTSVGKGSYANTTGILTVTTAGMIKAKIKQNLPAPARVKALEAVFNGKTS